MMIQIRTTFCRRPANKTRRDLTWILLQCAIISALILQVGCGPKDEDMDPSLSGIEIHEDWKELGSAIENTQKYYGLFAGAESSTVKPSWPGPLADDAPIVKLTFDELVKSIENEDQAQAKSFVEQHSNSWIEVSGVAGNFETQLSDHFDGSHYISLGLVATQGYRICPCFVRDAEIWNKVKTGDEITLRGMLVPVDESFGALLAMDNCQLVGQASDGVVEMSVDSLIKELKADPVAFHGKFNEKSIVLSGKYQGETEEYSEHLLAGEGGEKLTFNKTLMAELPNGTPIKLIGEVRVNLDEDGLYSIGPEGKVETSKGEVEFQLYGASRIDMFD